MRASQKLSALKSLILNVAACVSSFGRAAQVLSSCATASSEQRKLTLSPITTLRWSALTPAPRRQTALAKAARGIDPAAEKKRDRAIRVEAIAGRKADSVESLAEPFIARYAMEGQPHLGARQVDLRQRHCRRGVPRPSTILRRTTSSRMDKIAGVTRLPRTGCSPRCASSSRGCPAVTGEKAILRQITMPKSQFRAGKLFAQRRFL